MIVTAMKIKLTSGGNNPGNFTYSSVPSAGIHTYTLQFAGDGVHLTTIQAGTAGATEYTPGPASIEVELK